MNLSNPANLLIAGIYYVLVGLVSLFSLFGVYILIRYGRSLPLAFSIAVVYALFFLKILMETSQTLHALLS
ncbi:MAG: hypothetical protein P4L74_04105 [Candidatus Doudnabacteria bacterium]|nr:hypothetical protein [Candidatus Doudnabacteria bacterium]